MPPGAIVLSQTRQITPQRGSEGPDPGFVETLGAGFTAARADTTGQYEGYELRAYMEIANEMERLGGPRASMFVNPSTGTVSPEGVWRAMEGFRQRGQFKNLPRTRQEFDEQWKSRERERIARAEQTAARGNPVAAFGGGVGGAMTDPINLFALPFGGFGKELWKRVATEAVIGATIELGLQPVVAAQREKLGRDPLSIKEAATNVVFAGVGAGALRGGADIIGKNWDAIKAAPQAVQERAWAAILDRTPGLRERVGSTIDWDALDPYLPDVAEATIERTRMTDAERGAILALRRESEIEAANPFVPDGAGTASHYEMLGDALQGIISQSPAYVPQTRPSPAARLRTGSSIATGVTGDAMQTVKARIGVVESGGRANARNPRSSAMGLYQFTDGTWLAYYKARFGAQGLSNAQIIAKKGDTGLQNRLMDDLLADNAKALQDAGFVVDPGNLYLAHFAGRKGATGLLAADPATPAVRVLGQKVIDANPFLRGKTAGDVIAWARGKMGGKASPTPPAARAAAEGEADTLAMLDRELADTEGAIARLDSELEQGTGTIGAALDDIAPEAVPMAEATPLARIDTAPTRTPIEPVSANEIAGITPEARAIMPELRRIVDNERDVSLNRLAALSSRLGVDERNLQAALQQMAIDGLLVQGRSGNYARLPRRKDGPEDIFQFVAARGGLADTEGHDLKTIFEVERTVRWKRKPDKDGLGGIPLAEPFRTTRPALIPGYGPIVRRNAGMSVDDMGEALWEAGYFGPYPDTPRPTESEVIALLQDAWGSGRKVFSFYDAAQAAELEASAAAGVSSRTNPFASDFQSDEHFDFEWRQFDAAADEAFGITLDEEAFINAWGEYRSAGDGDMRGAVVRAVQREIEDVQAREIAERGLDDAEDIIAEWEAALRSDGIAGGEEGARPVFEQGDPGPDEPLGWASEWEETGPIDPERWQAWDEPDGDAAKITADSMEHDLRVQDERRRARRKDRPRDEARAAEQDARMRLALEQMAAERKARISDEEFMQRGDRKVATIAPILYRETSVENLFPYLPESGVVIGRGPAGAVHYTATTPDLALGQGSNRGVMIEIDAGEMTGRIDFSKPGAEVLAQTQRQAEVIVSAQDFELGRNIRSFTVRPDAEIRKVDRFRFNRVMRDLEAKGWTRSESPDGVTMTRPVAGVAPADPTPTITTRADGQDDFAAPTGAQVRTALERQTEGGIRPTGPQRAAGEDGGLFDTRDTTADLFDQAGFRLDEEGDVINPADLLAEFDEEAAFLKTIKDCL